MSEKYEDLRAKFDDEMRDRIENPLKHMARRDLADELQHCIGKVTNVGQPNRYVSVSLLERAISRIRELEDDRDSWAEQASQRVADWQREHDLRVAAERRVGELERAGQAGGQPSLDQLMALLPGCYYMDPPDGGSVTLLEQLQRMADDAERYRYLRSTGFYIAENGPWLLDESADRWVEAARAAMGGKEGA